MNKTTTNTNSDEDQLDPTLTYDQSYLKPIRQQQLIKHQSICQLLFHWMFQTVQNQERKITSEGSVYPRNCISNKINNQKYSFLTFLPKFLYNEYKYFQNLYFLLLALSQFYPPLKIGFLITYVGPIIVILFLSFMKELLDEIKRKQKDKKYNNQKYIKVCFNNQKYIKSQNIKVGDLLIIKKDQRVPADLILLKTTDKNGDVYVRTDQLDGETDWKTRDAIKFTQNLNNYQDVYAYQWQIQVEKPNDQIYNFKGCFQGANENELETLKLNNTIWANMRVASGEILGVVIYTGKETRISQNSKKPISKRGKTDKEINKLSKLLLITLVLIAIFLTFVSGRIFQENQILYLLRVFILLSAIIPVSMKVNLDFAKLQFCYWINQDQDIPGTITRNSNIPEELGRIEILLSDKTGTLTKNEMIFKQLKTHYEIIQQQNLNNFIQSIHNIENKLKNQQQLSEKQNQQLQLIRCLALCHNVWPVGQDQDRILQASSPDEIALVNFIENLGLILYERKSNEIILQKLNDQFENFQILYNFPFSSERKRMGIIIRDQQTQKYFFYLKGADIVIRKKVSDEDRLFVDEEAYNLSIEGLRTLVLCYKELTEDQFLEFDNQMKIAGQNLQKRDFLERKAISKLEMNIKVLGVSGVEDLLQDNLKSSIVTLNEAGIKVWMLTGDKMETAKCIAISTGFKNHQQQFLDLFETNLKTIEKKLDQYNPIQHTLVVTGNCLEIIFQDYYMIQNFFKKCIESQNVVLCRCAPKQKALIAHYLKNVYKKIVCCIGDGGNDVAMIQTGNIGIGIEGKEGMQAALSSDFSVVKFSNILKLFLWHGRLSYIRTCTLSNFVIQRGLIIAFIQVFFIITFYYVSINIYNGYLTFCYSTIFTNFPVFALIWDKDIPLNQLLNYPALYYMVQKGQNLNGKVFLFLIWKAFYQASIIFLLTIIIFDNSFVKIVTITFSVLIIIQYLNICNNINTWHRIILLSIVLSFLTYLICFLFFKKLFLISSVNFEELLYIFLIALCAWGPFFIFKYLEKLFSPTQIDKVIREAKMLKKRKQNGILNIKNIDQLNQNFIQKLYQLFY